MKGGTCTDGVTTYTCSCVTGYSGEICEISKYMKKCSKGSLSAAIFVILRFIYIYIYNMADLFVLYIDINDCIDGACLNEGTCIDGVNEYTCNCMPGYTGSNCQIGLFI